MEREIKLAESAACVGCAVCADVCPKECISMIRNGEGFPHPSIDAERCVACGRCTAACPALQESRKFGIKKLYAAWMKDTESLQMSTSGGVFQALARTVLADSGVVFGAAFDDRFNLLHTRCEDLEDLPALLGSKYLQSNTEGIYKAADAAAKAGKTVLFCGTPCQCDALARYYSSGNRSVPDNVILCELMCHGVPSPGVFEDYIAYLQAKKKRKIVGYNFRYKKLKGWRNLCECIQYAGGKKTAHRAKYDAWHVWFGAHLSVRTSCFDCKYRDIQRTADITLGDFWSIHKVRPDLETENGVSAVFINTEKGQKCFDGCTSLLSAEEIPAEKVETLFNVPIRKGTVKMPADRQVFFALYEKGGIKAVLKKFPPQNLLTAVIAKIKWMIKK